jgi:protein-tyrosine phosphatase
MKLLAGVGGSEEKGTSEYGIPDVIWTNSKTGG